MEAATLAQKQGFEYFKIVTVADATQVTSVYHPAQAHTSGSLTGNITTFGNMGDLRGSYDATTTLTPAHTDTFVHPGADLMLKFFHPGEVDPHAPGVWEVASVLGADGDNAAAPNVPDLASGQISEENPPAPASEPQAVPVRAQQYDAWRKSK